MKTWKRIVAFLLVVMLMVPSLSSIGTIEVSAAETTSENIALNKPTMATAGNSARAVDGNTTNYWDGSVAPSELIVDLEGYYALEEIVVIPYYGGHVTIIMKYTEVLMGMSILF